MAWRVFLAAASLCGTGPVPAIGADDSEVSLRDFAGGEAWVGDFRYDRVLVEAQGQECVAYTMDMKIRHVETLLERNLPWVSPVPSAGEDLIVGRSHGWSGDPEIEPQPIFGYMITDPDFDGPKLKVVLTGSNHAHEPPACWTLHGMVEFLVSDDPRSEALRQRAIFYVYPVVNPDGKVEMLTDRSNVNGNPELRAGGERNHNRVWDTVGRFRSIDVVKAALLNDTGGTADYLVDIHGIPVLSFAFAKDESAHSPLGRVLMAKTGYTLRGRPISPGMLLAWATSGEGFRADYAFTPEIANGTEEELLARGKELALAFHDVVANRIPPLRGLPKPTAAPEEPLPPKVRFADASEGLKASAILGHPADLTVAVWVTGKFDSKGTVPIVTRGDSEEGNLSWTVLQRPETRQMMVILSADGTRTRSVNKRFLSAGWPGFDVFDGNRRLVAFTFQSGGEGRLRLYIDGAELEAGKGLHIFDDGNVPAPYPANAPIVLGQPTAAGNRFAESIGEVAVWDSALSPGEIRWLFENGFPEVPQ